MNDTETPQLPDTGRPDPTREALAMARRAKEARQGFAPMPCGGLFDEVARAQLVLL